MPQTEEGNWKMAEWCRQNNLTKQRALHLEEILNLNPDHEGTRYGLGYQRLGGVWTTTQEHFEKLGYVLHKGQWKTPQEIEIEARAARPTRRCCSGHRSCGNWFPGWVAAATARPATNSAASAIRWRASKLPAEGKRQASCALVQ